MARRAHSVIMGVSFRDEESDFFDGGGSGDHRRQYARFRMPMSILIMS